MRELTEEAEEKIVKKQALWDVQEGRKMWEEGKTAQEIGAALGTRAGSVYAYARKHDWGPHGPRWRKNTYK